MADVPPTYQPEISATPLYQISFTYRRMHVYLGQTYSPIPPSTPSVQSPTTPNQYNLLSNEAIPSADGPPNQAQVYRALLHQTRITY